jgi:SnoaL-like domain
MHDLAAERFAIQQRLYSVSYTNDTHDLEAYLDIFTEDSVGYGYRLDEEEPFVVMRGRDDLRTFFERFPPIRVLHHLSGLVFDELTAETARTRVMVAVTARQSADSDPFLLTHGHYYDEWRKFPDAWRIEARRFLNWGFRTLGEEFRPWRGDEVDTAS